MNYFPAPWSKALHFTTWTATAFLIVITTFTAKSLGTGEPHVVWILILLLALIPACALLTVRGYTIEPDAIFIHRPLWKTKVSCKDLQSAAPDPRAFQWALRTCGNGGLFSFLGFYWSKHLGSFRAFVTDLRRSVVLRFSNGRTVVVSPDDPDAFVERLMTGRPANSGPGPAQAREPAP